MAEEAISAQVSAAAPAPEVAPVVTPIVESTPAVAPVSEVVAPVTPVVETAPVAETSTPLLSPIEEPKSEANTDAPIEPPKPEAQPAPLPVYEFKLPEGANADNPQFKTFMSKLGEIQNLTKGDQAIMQKFGQEMIDMHMQDMKSILENQNKANWDWFSNRNKEWLENSKKDPSIGGSDENFTATLSAGQTAISLYGGTKAQQLETAKLLHETGVENHPAMLRFLSNITKIAAKEGTPVAGSNVPAQKSSIAQAMYGQTTKAS